VRKVPGYAPQGFDPLREEVRRVMGPECALTVEVVAHSARGRSGKAPMMLSNVRLPLPAHTAQGG
jgi:hypothetical protein